MKYDCNYYEHKTTWQYNRTAHKILIYKGVMIDYNHCDFRVTQQHSHTTYMKSVHEGVRYLIIELFGRLI